jgi:hypothetical protein
VRKIRAKSPDVSQIEEWQFLGPISPIVHPSLKAPELNIKDSQVDSNQLKRGKIVAMDMTPNILPDSEFSVSTSVLGTQLQVD